MTAQPEKQALTTRGFILRLVAGVLLLSLFLGVFLGMSLKQSWLEYQKHAAITTQNLSQVLEENIAGDIEKIDVALLTIRDEVRRQSASGGIDGKALNSFLARQKDYRPELIGIRFADAHGTVKYGTDVKPDTNVNNADRDYFIRSRDDTDAGLVISKPVLARISKVWVINLARRIDDANGAFIGVVWAVIGLEHFGKTFPIIDVGRHGVIHLRDDEFKLILRHPTPQDLGGIVGKSVSTPVSREATKANKETGTYIVRGVLDNIERTFSYHKIPGHPLTVTVGLASDDYLEEWREQTVKLSALATLFFLATLSSSWYIYRGWKRQTAAMESLARQEEKFRTVADFTYDWEYWEGANHEILYMTPSCERITGYTQAEFVADPDLLYRIIHPDDAILMAEHLHDSAFQDDATVDFRIMHRDSAIKWIAHCCKAVYWGNAQFMGRRASNRDITLSKEIEEALREAEERFRMTFESAAIGMALLSLDGHFLQVNSALIWIVGYPEEELLQKTMREITHPDDLEIDRDLIHQLLRGEQLGYHIEKRFLHKNGHVVWIQLSASVVVDKNSRHLSFVVQIQDISERKEAVDALRRLNENLDHRVKEEVEKNLERERMLIQQSRLAAMGEMIGNIAHQWRQPLSALGLLIANIKDAYDYHELDEATLEDSVATGRKYIEKMSSTIDDFKNFFKPNKLKQDFSLHKAIEDALNLVSHSFKTHNIAVSIDGEDVVAHGFPNEFSQVLLNLLNNAKDALGEKNIPCGKIEIRLGCDGGRAFVAVKDNAGGVPAEILPKIFDPYFTTKEKGTGIGLYMSRMIMEHMDGTIEAINAGDGAEFRLALPKSES